MIEKRVEDIVKRWLVTKNAYFKKNKGSIYLDDGTPDFQCCINGSYIGIETKTSNGHKVSALQIFEGFKITVAKGIYVIAYEDFQDIESLPSEKFDFSADAKKAKNLVEFSDTDFDKLENLMGKINANKKSIVFYSF